MDKKLGKNLLFNTGYSILSVIVPFITAPYLARVLGAYQVGAYTYTQAVGTCFFMAGALGLSNYGNRTIAEVRDDRIARSRLFWEIYSMQLLTGVFAAVGYLIYLLALFPQHKVLAFTVGLYVLTAMTNIDWYCQGVEEFKRLVIRSFLIKLLNLVCIFAFVRSRNDTVIYAVIMSGGYLLSTLMMWPFMLRDVDFTVPSGKGILRHFKPNVLLFIPYLAASVYQIMDKIMIGTLASEVELAYYEYADKIISFPNFIFTSIGSVMLSRMSYLFKNSRDDAEGMIGRLMELSFLISLPCCFGILAVGEELTMVYYGKEFVGSAPVLAVLTPVIVLYGWANVLRMQYIIPNRMEMIYIGSTIAGAAVNLAMNLLLIPRYQAVGAAVGTVFAHLTVAGVFSVCLKERLPLTAYFKNMLPIAGIAAIMFICVTFVRLRHEISVVGLAVDVLVGACIFCVLALLYLRGKFREGFR